MKSWQDKCEEGKYIITTIGTQCQQENRHQTPDACLVMVYCFQTHVAKYRDSAIQFSFQQQNRWTLHILTSTGKRYHNSQADWVAIAWAALNIDTVQQSTGATALKKSASSNAHFQSKLCSGMWDLEHNNKV